MSGDAVGQQPRQPKITELERVADQEKVLRFDVAVLDVPLLQKINALRGIAQIAKQFLSWNAGQSLGVRLSPTVHQGAVRQLHRYEETALHFPGIIGAQ